MSEFYPSKIHDESDDHRHLKALAPNLSEKTCPHSFSNTIVEVAFVGDDLDSAELFTAAFHFD